MFIQYPYNMGYYSAIQRNKVDTLNNMDNCGVFYANLSKQDSDVSKNDFIYMPFWESKTTGAENRSAVVLRLAITFEQ